VEKSQYDLCIEVLRRLDKSGVLKHIVLVGSWCTLFYEKYFTGIKYASVLKTRDIDFLIPRPTAIRQTVSIAELLKDLGFITGFTGMEGYIRLEHPQLIVEFLVPETGRGLEKPYNLPLLGLNAQALRFLDFLGRNTITVEIQGIKLTLPHPASFGLHKLLVLRKRRDREKTAKDMQDAARILRALVEKGETEFIKNVFSSMPRKWQNKIKKSAKELADEKLSTIFGE
jgi:hypothetical protein